MNTLKSSPEEIPTEEQLAISKETFEAMCSSENFDTAIKLEIFEKQFGYTPNAAVKKEVCESMIKSLNNFPESSETEIYVADMLEIWEERLEKINNPTSVTKLITWSTAKLLSALSGWKWK